MLRESQVTVHFNSKSIFESKKQEEAPATITLYKQIGICSNAKYEKSRRDIHRLTKYCDVTLVFPNKFQNIETDDFMSMPPK